MNFGSQPFLHAVARDMNGVKIASEEVTANKADRLLYDVACAHLDILRKIAMSSGCKTIQKDHLRLAQELASAMRPPAQRKQRGGAETVLPAEYFGKDSGAYFADVRAAEHTTLGGDTLSRAALPASFPGAGQQLGGCDSPHHSECGSAKQKKSGDNKKGKQAAPKKGKQAKGGAACQQCGGAETVLPSEYFGGDSGRYFAHDVISGLEHSTAGSDAAARQALPMTFGAPASQAGGGSGHKKKMTARISEDVFMNIVREYKRRHASAAGELRIADNVKGPLRTKIALTAEAAIFASHAQRKTSSLTPACLDQAAKKFVVFA